jgi:2-aminoadipate transaminase
MNNLSFSKTGDRLVADPIAELFKSTQQHIMAYKQKTGNDFISLAAGAPDDTLLPSDAYKQLVAEVLLEPSPSPLNYSMPKGIPALRRAMESMLARQQVLCDADQHMLITSGGMEAISIAAWLVLNPGDTVITEGPGFAGALSLFEALGANVVQINAGQHGIDPNELAAAIQKHSPKLLLLMPDFQNPTGALMPLESRKAIAALLQKHSLYAIEDAAYSQLGFDGQSLPPLQSFAPHHVLYATSVSKILAPAMRIGALVAPMDFIGKAADLKSAFNMQASTMHQAITAQFLQKDEDYLQPQLDKLRSTYKARCSAMISALEKYFPDSSGYRWTRPEGGMFLWLTGPEGTNFTNLFDKAVDNGVSYIPGSAFYGPRQKVHTSARLNFASTTERNIEEAVRRLATTLATL